jgi:ABC-type phosphate transport system permease subunit
LLWFPILADEFFSSLLLGLSRGIGEELAVEVRVFREVSDEVLGPVRILDPVDNLLFARRDFDVRRSIVLVAVAFAFRGLRRRA